MNAWPGGDCAIVAAEIAAAGRIGDLPIRDQARRNEPSRAARG
ncbi:MAG TPA: hypothetical protein PKC97_11135 [Burkholderiaceae bacterium]|nr:hypothetical protein [Burkholderiaceae bacterium]